MSLPFDRRLWPDDIAGSRAHVHGAGRTSACSTADEPTSSWRALEQIESELAGDVRVRRHRRGHPHRRSSVGSPSSPGRPGAKLHTGRSRNDQVATDLRRW